MTWWHSASPRCPSAWLLYFTLCMSSFLPVRIERLLSVSSTGCIPLVYLAVYQTPSSPFSSVCNLIACASVFAAGLFPSRAQHITTRTKSLIDSTPLLSNAVCCTLPVWHGYCSQQRFMFLVLFFQKCYERVSIKDIGHFSIVSNQTITNHRTSVTGTDHKQSCVSSRLPRSGVIKALDNRDYFLFQAMNRETA